MHPMQVFTTCSCYVKDCVDPPPYYNVVTGTYSPITYGVLAAGGCNKGSELYNYTRINCYRSCGYCNIDTSKVYSWCWVGLSASHLSFI